MSKKMIYLVSFVLVLGLVSTNVTFGGKVWESRVSSGNDDAEQDVPGGGMDLSSSDLEIFDDGGLQVIGLRFVDIPIPKGAIVDNAFVEITCDETKGGTQPVSVLIEGEMNPNPPTFADVTNNITNRPTTTAKVVWVPVNWTEEGQTARSSDITSIIQEIIDQDDWAMGNALVLILRDDPDNPSEGVRCTESASDPSGAPLLHIEFRGKFAVEPIPADGGLYEDTSAVLNWLPGLNSVSHDVYFGENFTDVSDGTGGTFQGNQAEAFFTVGLPGFPVPDGLVPGTTYYWRIDEIEADGTTINKGDVWSFTVPSKKAYNHNLSDGACFIDPDTDLSWTAGSGAKVHTVFFGDNFDDVSSAVVGLEQASTTYDPRPLELEKTYYWRVDEFDGVETHKGDVLSFTTIGARGTGLRGDYYTGENFDEFVLTRMDPQIDFGWGDSAPDEAVGGNNFSVRWTGDVSAQFTDTYTFYTITDDGIRVWVDGKLIIENWTLHGDTEDTGTIDLVAGRSYNIVLEYFENTSGAVARLGWESPHTTKQIIPTYLLWPPLKARNPNPPNGAIDVKQTPYLTWSAGEAAASHRIYFGTEEEAVKNANMASPEFIGLDELDAEGYTPGKLQWDTTYYWRIDEVNDANPDSPWIGNVWSFTTADFLIVDDFEDYDAYNQIWWSWHDGAGYVSHPTESPYAGNGTGSMVGDENTPSYTEETIVHGGNQSMPLFYDNSVLKYSEVEMTLSYPRDWTENGVSTLTIWFRGSSDNAAETLYVALNGSAVVTHDNPNAAQIDKWTQWSIDLQVFADQGVNLDNVNTIAIGLGDRNNPQPGGKGMMYFDDIRLVRPAAAPEPEADPSLVIYYSFDEVSDIVADQSGKGHDGVVIGAVTAEANGKYNGAANFASGSYLDLDGPSFPTEDIPTSGMTLAAWIKCANTGGDHEIFSARASDGSWLIHPEPKSSGDIRWLLRSYGGTTIFQIRAGTMTWDEWLHFAGTYDKASSKAALYINGELIEEVDVASPADIAGDWDQGARVGYTIDNARPFTGLMDEFRMFTRALTQAEIQEIMQGM